MTTRGIGINPEDWSREGQPASHRYEALSVDELKLIARIASRRRRRAATAELRRRARRAGGAS